MTEITIIALGNREKDEPAPWDLVDEARAKGAEIAEVTKEGYWEALEVLPPIYLFNANTHTFAVCEAHSHNGKGESVHHCFTIWRGKYYGTLGTLNEARERFAALKSGAPVRTVDKDGVLLEAPTTKAFENAVESGQAVSLCGLSKTLGGQGS